MKIMTWQNILEMSWLRFLQYWTIRQLKKELIWRQRWIHMDNKEIKILHANVLEHDKERINIRCQLRDLGIDPDVVAPPIEEKEDE